MRFHEEYVTSVISTWLHASSLPIRERAGLIPSPPLREYSNGGWLLAVKDTYARKSLRYNFSPTLADHPGIFHAKLPPAGASQLVLAPPLPSLNRATRDPPLFLSPIRRRGALSSFHGLATPVDPNCEIHEGEYPAGGFWRRKECVHRGH